MNRINVVKETLDQIENGFFNIYWEGWVFSGRRAEGNYQEYSIWEEGERIGRIQITGDDTVNLLFDEESADGCALIGAVQFSSAAFEGDLCPKIFDFDDPVLVKRAENVLNKALARDDKQILAACGDKTDNIYLPAGPETIVRQQVTNSLHYTTKTSYDTVTVTKHGYDDFDIYFHNGDCSVRGTATDILQELTQNELHSIKEFAIENFSKEDDQLTVASEPSGIAVSNPWMDASARFSLDDADAFFHWNIQVVVDFCIQVMEVLNDR